MMREAPSSSLHNVHKKQRHEICTAALSDDGDDDAGEDDRTDSTDVEGLDDDDLSDASSNVCPQEDVPTYL